MLFYVFTWDGGLSSVSHHGINPPTYMMCNLPGQPSDPCLLLRVLGARKLAIITPVSLTAQEA